MKGKNIKDYTLIAKVSVMIDKYVERLNFENTELWNIKEVIAFLMQETSQISFTNYFEFFVSEMRRNGREDPANNYKSAYNSLSRYADKKHFYFSEITAKLINGWIESLKNTSVAKNHYPTWISAVFNAGALKYNDYERGILRIKNQPFMHVNIPNADTAEKRAIEKEVLLQIFNADISNLRSHYIAEFAKDII